MLCFPKKTGEFILLAIIYLRLMLTYYERPYFVKGCAIGCAFTGLICVLSLGLHFKLAHENKKRDAATGPIDPTEALDLTQLSDKHPNFRYFT